MRLFLLSVVLVCLLASCGASHVDGAWRDQKYLLPILRAGPNNQLRHLRYMIALAKQLNRTIILTGITKHYTDRGTRYRLPKAKPSQGSKPESSPPLNAHYATDIPSKPQCFKEDMPYHMEFSEILDRQYLEEFIPVTTADEMKARGWDGVIDALVYPNDTIKLDRLVPYLGITTQAAKVHMYHDLAVATTPNKLQCKADAIEALRKKIDKWRVVAMYFLVIGHGEVVSLPGELQQERPSQEGCWRDLYDANRRLKANAWLRGIASRYVADHVGSEPFLAMHIRPQADGCLKLWMQRNFDPKQLGKKGVCWAGHDLLHHMLGPKAVAAMSAHNIKHLVVLTHPHLQPVINDLLAKVNITNHKYIQPQFVEEIAGCADTSSSFLMLVEMQVAVQSDWFLGTASSSITETVIYERLANGITANEFVDRPFPKYPPPPAAPSQPPASPVSSGTGSTTGSSSSSSGVSLGGTSSGRSKLGAGAQQLLEYMTVTEAGQALPAGGQQRSGAGSTNHDPRRARVVDMPQHTQHAQIRGKTGWHYQQHERLHTGAAQAVV